VVIIIGVIAAYILYEEKFGSSISAGVRDIYVNINRWLDKRLEGVEA